jgi:hypothetical protein
VGCAAECSGKRRWEGGGDGRGRAPDAILQRPSQKVRHELRAHTHTHTRSHTHRRTQAHTHRRTHRHTLTRIYIYIYRVCVFVCVCLCAGVCMLACYRCIKGCRQYRSSSRGSRGSPSDDSAQSQYWDIQDCLFAVGWRGRGDEGEGRGSGTGREGALVG